MFLDLPFLIKVEIFTEGFNINAGNDLNDLIHIRGLWFHTLLSWLHGLPQVKVSWPSTPQHLCLSPLLWFTDADLAEPPLLLILCWIQTPGQSEGPSMFAAPASSPDLQTGQDVHAWVCFLCREPRGACCYKDRVTSLKEEVRGPPSEEICLHTGRLEQRPVLPNADGNLSRHGGWWSS